jgi:hypothetical protein
LKHSTRRRGRVSQREREEQFLSRKQLFLEKEDLVSILRQAGFLDRWDCFAMSSKGFSTRAARDLFDKIGAAGSNEPTKFFCVHDADASGSMISQTLSAATKARAARRVEVIDLGLFPWEALAEGLPRERVEKKTSQWRPVAEYVKARDLRNKDSGSAEPKWEEWLQNWRVELNAMTSEQFVKWMDAQFARHKAAKVIPSAPLALEAILQDIHKSILSAAGAELRQERKEELDALQRQFAQLESEIAEESTKRAEERIKKIELPSAEVGVKRIERWLKKTPAVTLAPFH